MLDRLDAFALGVVTALGALPDPTTYPELLNGLEARLWSRFFCLSVYITMYLNDHARSAFYEALGLNTTQFNRHVILETNNATARVFPEVRAPASVGCPTDCWSVGRA